MLLLLAVLIEDGLEVLGSVVHDGDQERSCDLVEIGWVREEVLEPVFLQVEDGEQDNDVGGKFRVALGEDVEVQGWFTVDHHEHVGLKVGLFHVVVERHYGDVLQVLDHR